MNRELKSIARWLTMFMIVVGLLGAMPMAAMAQDPATPGAVNEDQTDPPPVENPVVVPTEIPSDPPPAEDPVIVPTEEPTAPPVDEGSVDPVATPGAPSAGIQAIEAQQETGTVVVNAVDDGGDDVPNACFSLFQNIGGNQGPLAARTCDNVDGNDGRTSLGAVGSGSYILVASFAPPGFVVGGSQIVMVVSGETTTVTFEFASGGRTIRVTRVDDLGDPLPGSCFSVNENRGGGQPGNVVGENCSDPSRTDGLVFIFGVLPGEYVLVEYQTPIGFDPAPPQPFTLPAGEGNFHLTVSSAGFESPGGLIVNKVDENNQPLADACFDVFFDQGGGNPGQFLFGRCDGADGQNDGETVFLGLEAGSYVLIESVAPPGYVVGGILTFSISSGEQTVLTVPNARGGAVVTVNKFDENGDPLRSSCFGIRQMLDGGGSAFVVGSCDQNDGINDGRLNFRGVAPGDYILFESVVPEGFVRANDIPFTINASSDDLSINVTNLPIESPGNLIIDKVDENGAPLSGACFVAFVDTGGGTAGEFVGGACDSSDGLDGTTVIANLDSGEFVVRETLAPAGYRFGGEFLVTIPAQGDTATTLTVPNELGGAMVTVTTIDQNGDSLSGVCFGIYLDDGSGLATPGSFFTQGCTGSSLVFTGFPPGDYVLVVFSAPFAYENPENVLFTVSPDEAAQVVTVQLVVSDDPVVPPVDPVVPVIPGLPGVNPVVAPVVPVTPGVGDAETAAAQSVSGLPDTGSAPMNQPNSHALLAGVATMAALMAAYVWRRRLA